MALPLHLVHAILWLAVSSCFLPSSVDAGLPKLTPIALSEAASNATTLQHSVLETSDRDSAGFRLISSCKFTSVAQQSTHGREIRALIDSGQLSQARAALKARVSTEGETHETLLLEALILTKEKQFGEAMQKLQRSIALNPSDADAHYQLAMNAIIVNQLDIAEPELAAALRLGVDGFMIHFHRGMLYYTTNRFALAEAEFQKVVERNPAYVKGYEFLALAQEELRPEDTVIENYRRAVAQVERQKLKDESPYLRLLKFLWAKNREDSALATARKAVDMNANSAEAHFLLGRLLERSGQFEEAQRSLKRAIEIDPEFPEALYLLSRLYLKQGNEQESSRLLEQFRNAKRRRPNDQRNP